MNQVEIYCPRCSARVKAIVSPHVLESVEFEHQCKGFTAVDRQKMVWHALDLGTQSWGALVCEF